MGKAKPGQNKDLNSTKQQLHTIKNGSVKKDKNPKFKNTPVGKVALINNSKAQNKNTSPQKNFQKDAGLKNNQNLSKNSAKQSKRNSAKNKQNSPNKGQNKPANKKINLNPKKELEEIDDSDSDIDEEITLQEDVSLTKLGETSEDEEESDIDIPDILGKSLEDESDEDDEDFDEEEEEEENEDDDDIKGETVERINVKTFEGVKPKVKKNDDKDNKNKIGLGQIYPSIKEQVEQILTDDDDDDEDEDEFESDEDDEDFEEEEEEEDDDGDDNIEEETVEHKGVKMFKGVKTKVKNSDEDEDEDDDDEDEDEDEEEDEEDEENEEDEDSALGLKALLGNNITDEDDDEDFNEEDEDDEDDDISDEDEDGEENDNVVKVTKEKAAKASNSKDIPKEHKQVKEGEKKLSPEEQEEIDKRTIFIDNVPIKETSKADLKHHFGKFGPINNLRIRSIIPQDPKMSKKLAAIRKQIHPTAPTVVVYINYKSQESAQKAALCMNGKIFRGNYIHVDIAHKSAKKRDNKKAVFIGNLKWGMDNNSIWKHFGKCGEIESVHLIRDKQTGQTKGFGYVNFKTEESAVLALKLDGDEILNRPIRVKPCLSVENKKGKKRVSSNNDGNPQKKLKNNLEKPVPRKAENEANINKHKKLQKNNAKPEEQKSISFQGQKADSKKKKENKFDKKKKEMAKKLTAKSNKPVKI